jgi:hypothetical protein
MGFWSAVGGAVRSVGRAVSSAWETAKEVAGKAVEWMADKAEKFVDGVKNAWKVVKPFVEHIRTGIRAAAAAIPIPWLKAALILLDNGLGALTAFENSPIAKKVDAAIKWSIELAKRWQQHGAEQQQASEAADAQAGDRLSEEELERAKQHQETFRFAEREIVPEGERHQLELAAAINDFEIAKTDLAKVIDAAPADFEHYLRLRATQKLLNMADKKFRTAKSIDELSADDLFLVRIASDLIKPSPELSREAAARLDRLLTERHGKKLTPFIFEELIASWAKRAEVLEKQWELDNRAHAKDSMLFKRLSLAKEVQGELSADEARELAQLQTELPAKKQALDDLSQRQRDVQRYVGAAEGFLQLLEKTPEQIEEEDRGFLLEDGAHVGKLLIDCAENDKPFDRLAVDDQAMINDFANAFRKDSKNRMKDILEVTV